MPLSRVLIVVVVVLMVSGAALAHARADADDRPMDLPSNLRVPRVLRPALLEALRRSPTFRRQMQTLRRAERVRVTVEYGGLRGIRPFQAQSVVRHHEYGALVVETTVFAPADMVELIAHEIEHVCEQIEGVDLRMLATRPDSGVYQIGGHYETPRAILAGHRVRREMRGLSVPPPTNE